MGNRSLREQAEVVTLGAAGVLGTATVLGFVTSVAWEIRTYVPFGSTISFGNLSALGARIVLGISFTGLVLLGCLAIVEFLSLTRSGRSLNQLKSRVTSSANDRAVVGLNAFALILFVACHLRYVNIWNVLLPPEKPTPICLYTNDREGYMQAATLLLLGLIWLVWVLSCSRAFATLTSSAANAGRLLCLILAIIQTLAIAAPWKTFYDGRRPKVNFGSQSGFLVAISDTAAYVYEPVRDRTVVVPSDGITFTGDQGDVFICQ